MQHAAGSPQQFCLRWNNYQNNLTNVFDQLLQSESFVDVTLACDGHSVKAHKMVLSACSPYFQALFFENPCQHPIVIMRDIKWPELKAAVEFMYKGEINVSQEQIGPLLKVAETLKIRGLADVNGEQDIAAASATAELTARPASRPATQTPAPEWGARPDQTPQGAGAASDNSEARTKRRRRSGERSSLSSPAESAGTEMPEPPPSVEMSPAPSATPLGSTGTAATETLPLPLAMPPQPQVSHSSSTADDMEIKPGIAEMIREEERVSVYQPHKKKNTRDDTRSLCGGDARLWFIYVWHTCPPCGVFNVVNSVWENKPHDNILFFATNCPHITSIFRSSNISINIFFIVKSDFSALNPTSNDMLVSLNNFIRLCH
ncbi:hypothetical protein GWI33_020943 [Rhynchophorus ferrugineus]|uniref:BTB domain-containing protein n=1 Tax=Rhynchophorus ferrugineus TaxID=354439 RepID=A0A834HTH4_RHYFE|nr:hypothetical protein GWI33_020943 [Rhynchophorus ferrugineus]